MDKAVQAASQCFRGTDWSSPKSASQRAEVLRKMGAAIRDQSEILSTIETMDNGKPYGESEADIGKFFHRPDFVYNCRPMLVF